MESAESGTIAPVNIRTACPGFKLKLLGLEEGFIYRACSTRNSL